MKTLDRPATASRDSAPFTVPTTNLRVLHVITGMLKGGAEKVATQLSVPRGEKAAIAWLKGPNGWAEAFAGSNVSLHPLGMQGLLDLPRAISSLKRIIRQYQPDVVHTHLVHAHVVGRFAAKRAGAVPVVSTEHNLRVYTRTDQRWLDSLDVKSSRQTAAIVAISEAAKSRCFAVGYRRETMHVVYNGVDVPVDVPPSPNGRRPVLTMVGRLRMSKGPDLFIRALEHLPNVDAILVGDGEERATIEKLILQMRDPKRLNWLPHGNAMEAMSNADIVVMPSRHEGLGLVALEAMSIERPVVATCVGGLVEVVEDGITGRLVPPESPALLVEAIEGLLENACLRASMGRAGRRRVEEKFTLSHMLESYDQIYRSVAA